MTSSQMLLIGALALAAFGVRVVGLVAGQRIRASRFAPILDELPGLIIVSLVAASLAGAPAIAWGAAVVALLAAWRLNDVILTMVFGVAAFAGLTQLVGG